MDNYVISTFTDSVVKNDPAIIKLWNSPGFSEFVVAAIVAVSSLGIAIYNNRHQKKLSDLRKRRDAAEKILAPFTELLIEFEQIPKDKNLLLIVSAALSTHYSLNIDEGKWRKRLQKAKTLAKLYAPGHIDEQVSTLSG